MGNSDELIEAFTAAVPFALREMAGVEAVARGACPATAADRPADLSAVIRLTTTAGVGQFILSLPVTTAAELARRVLAATAAEGTADMVRDCLGEVANVVAGQAKVLLVGRPSHFTLSTPTVRTGGPSESAGASVIRFESDAGPFAVYVYPPS